MNPKPWIGLCRSFVWPRVVGVVARVMVITGHVILALFLAIFWPPIGTILAAFQEGSDEY